MPIAAFQNHLVLQSLHFPPVPCRTPAAHSATWRADLGTKSWNNPHTEWQINAPHGDTHCVLSEQKGVNLDSFFWQEVCQETKRGKTNVAEEGHIEALWERFGTMTLESSVALQRNISVREAMEFNFPHSTSSTPSSAVWRLWPRREAFSPNYESTSKRNGEHGESNRLHFVAKASGKHVPVLRLKCEVWERSRCAKLQEHFYEVRR